jgi:hypothetical protein
MTNLQLKIIGFQDPDWRTAEDEELSGVNSTQYMYIQYRQTQTQARTPAFFTMDITTYVIITVSSSLGPRST